MKNSKHAIRILIIFVLCLLLKHGGLGAAESAPPRFTEEIRAFEASDQKSFPPTGGILFVGSSSIRLWKTLAEDFPGLPVINRGFGGVLIREVLYYADRIILPYKPRLIVLFIGGNDIADGRAPEEALETFVVLSTLIHEKFLKPVWPMCRLIPASPDGIWTTKFGKLTSSFGITWKIRNGWYSSTATAKCSPRKESLVRSFSVKISFTLGLKAIVSGRALSSLI